MKALKIALTTLLFLMMVLSFWLWGKIKKLQEQLNSNKKSLTTASTNITELNDLEKRLKNLEDCFEE